MGFSADKEGKPVVMAASLSAYTVGNAQINREERNHIYAADKPGSHPFFRRFHRPQGRRLLPVQLRAPEAPGSPQRLAPQRAAGDF